MIYSIPLRKVPSDSVSALLDNQPVTIGLRELKGRQYLSASLGGTVLCSNVLIVDRSPIVRAAYKGFVGDLYCVDTQGNDSPKYTGWNDRWQLVFKGED